LEYVIIEHKTVIIVACSERRNTYQVE